ncbi:MAG: Mut7-C RNAse domain-containing protein, partial [Desulfobulbus sp.]
DVLEAFGVPHTEIGHITCNGTTVGFSHLVQDHQEFIVKPVPVPWDLNSATPLRPPFQEKLRFLVDGNVGRLARYLRMAGFDTRYDPAWTETDLLRILQDETRILLTRNLDLLKRKQIVFGHCIRSSDPVMQLREVFALFSLSSLDDRLTRCLQCNELLQPVPKRDILARLEPLTIRYFDEFKICPTCDKIYWHGSHVDKMTALLAEACPIMEKGTAK